MTGNKPRRMVIQPRDEQLLHELVVMRIIDREQAKMVAGFRSTTRANARLLRLYQTGLLRRFFQGTAAGGKKALYTLSQKGARLVGAPYRGFRHQNDQLIVTNFFVVHQLAINEVYCLAKYRPIESQGTHFVRWLSFSEPVAQGLRLVPDGYFEVRTPDVVISAFLEVDLGNEGLAIWKEKVRNYLRYAASGNFQEHFSQPQFRVLVITNTEQRMEAIRRVVRGFTEKILWFSTFAAIRNDGLWGPVWLRPTDNSLRSFV